VEGRSIVEDRRPRNSYHRVCYVFVAQAVSACHWNWTAMGDGLGGDPDPPGEGAINFWEAFYGPL